jgi:hypothetical protein
MIECAENPYKSMFLAHMGTKPIEQKHENIASRKQVHKGTF